MKLAPRLTRREKVFLAFGALVAVVALFYVLVHEPRLARRDRERAALDTDLQTLRQARVVVSKQAELEARLKAAHDEIAQVEARVPGTRHIPGFLVLIESAARKESVRINTLKVGQEIKEKSLLAYSIDITATGSFDGHWRFLRALEELPRLVNIESFSLRGGDKGALTAFYQVKIYADPSKGAGESERAEIGPNLPMGRGDPFRPASPVDRDEKTKRVTR